MADGEVRINVDLVTAEAMRQASTLEATLKKLDVNPSLNTRMQDISNAIKKSGDIAKLTQADYDSLQGSLKSTAAYWKNLGDAQDQAGLKYSAAASHQREYQAELTSVRAEMARQAQTVEDLSKKQGDNTAAINDAQNKYIDLAGQEAKLRVESQKLGDEYGRLTPQMAAAADKSEALAQKFKSAGDKLSSIGQTMTIGVTAPIVAGLGYAAKAAVSFDNQIQSMGALLDDGKIGASALKAELNNLGDASKKWSIQYGVATDSINDGMSELIKKGYSYNQVLGAMPSLLDATKASGDQFADVMHVATSTLEQFGLKSQNTTEMLKNTQRVTDALTYVANETSAGFSDMGYAMEYVGPVAHGLNMSLEQTAAAIGLMSNQGIEGQKAGTSLRGALSALLTPSKQNMIGFKALGISVEAYKKGIIGLPEILDSIRAKSAGMTKQQLQSNLALAFGTEAQAGMNILVSEGGDALRKLTDETKTSNGYTQKLAETMNNTAAANVSKLKESLHVLSITAGQELVPELNDAVKWLTQMLQKFNDMDPATRKQIIQLALMVAAGGPVISMFGKMTSGVGSFLGTAPRLAVWLSKFGRGASAAGEGASWLTKTVGGLTSAASTAVPSIAAAGSAATDAGVAAGTSAVSLGSMASGLTAVLGPAALVAAGVVAVGTAAFFAIKAYKEHQEQMAKYKKTMDEFGVNVDENTQKAVRSFNSLRQSAQNDMAQLDTATVSQSQQLSQGVVNKYGKMADLVIAQFNKTRTNGLKALSDISSSFGTAGSSWLSEVTTAVNKNADAQNNSLTRAKQTMQDLLKEVGGDFSKLTEQQKQLLQDAERTIEEQTSAFGVSLKQQQLLYQAYVDSNGKLTDKMFDSQLTKSQSAYDKSQKAAQKSYNQRLSDLQKMHRDQQLSDEQYEQARTMLLAQRNANETKSSIQLINTQKATYAHYNNNGLESLRTRQRFNQQSLQIDQQGNAGYRSMLTGRLVSEKEWIAETKEDNAQYIAEMEKQNGSVAKKLDDFAKSQKKAYLEMGLSDQQARAQAAADRQAMVDETTKTGSVLAATAAQVHTDYLKALANGGNENSTNVAKQWGLDITNATQKVQLGKFGEKTAQQFWQDFMSGSQTGIDEAKVYFQTMLQEMKQQGKTSFASLSDSDVAALREGLKSGVVSLQSLKSQFGDSILGLFPRDLSQASGDMIKTLKTGLQTGVLSLDSLHTYFQSDIYKLFPNDLSSVGTKVIDTLLDGMKKGWIRKSDVEAQYKQQLNNMYNADLSKIGAKNMTTLANGLRLGLPEATKVFDELKKQIDPRATIDLKGHGQETIASLVKGFEDKKISVTDFVTGLSGLIDKTLTLDESGHGTSVIQTWNQGMVDSWGLPTGTSQKIRQNVEDNLKPTDSPHNSGESTMNNLNAGLIARAPVPIGTTADTVTAMNDNFNAGGESANNLSSKLGGKGNPFTAIHPTLKRGLNAYAKGTDGRLARSGLAVVGDGGMPELVDQGNGNYWLSPAVPTLTQLNKGAQVFSGPDTQKITEVSRVLDIPLFAEGSGGNVLSWIGDKVGDAWNWIKGAVGDLAEWIMHPIQSWQKLVGASYDMSGFPAAAGQEIGSAGKGFESKQTNWLTKLVNSLMNGGSAKSPYGGVDQRANIGMTSVARWRPEVIAAIAQLGNVGTMPLPEKIDRVLAEIWRESRGQNVGNQSVIDQNTGVDPAQGILQMIGSTFSHWAIPGHGDRMNPYDEILAAVNGLNSLNRWGAMGTGLNINYLSQGGHFTKPTMAMLAETVPYNEYAINPAASSAPGLTTSVLADMAKERPAALAQVKLPGSNITAEMASGFRATAHVLSTPATSDVATNGNSGQSSGLANVISQLGNLVDALKGDINLSIGLDSDTIARVTFPKTKLLLNNDMTIQATRQGWHRT
ncbi:phage tail tape measure protein [Schleiferilactobacillus harbinensis]|uniref:Phage tail tape measure protein n=1 Tax=Schleiferilactobacillus harbinensis TaxID=304207 RepID=A0A5P8M6H9_9LACO|nr:phage tail tape measure protein [Schleiferilactobacillus harbinensis]QFR24083.1 phage tail tape measure protein [Schleiferilactobacillus harbinensis]